MGSLSIPLGISGIGKAGRYRVSRQPCVWSLEAPSRASGGPAHDGGGQAQALAASAGAL